MTFFHSLFSITRIALLALIASTPALAVDGVAEINQTSVNAAGGFPFTISQPGSYVLTSDLVVPDANTTGVSIQTADVTLDLNGFSIRCSGCAATGAGDGVFADTAFGNVAVRGGSISGVGNRGLALLGELAMVDDVKITNAGGRGMLLGARALVTRSHVANSGNAGLELGRDSIASEVVSIFNQSGGVRLNAFAIASEVIANENQGTGFFISEGSVVIDSSGTQNSQKGLVTEKAVVVRSAFNTNQSNGADCFDCVMLSNTISANQGWGINSDEKTGYGYNVLQFNATAPAFQAVQLNENACGLFQTCPN